MPVPDDALTPAELARALARVVATLDDLRIDDRRARDMAVEDLVRFGADGDGHPARAALGVLTDRFGHPYDRAARVRAAGLLGKVIEGLKAGPEPEPEPESATEPETDAPPHPSAARRGRGKPGKA